VKELSEMTIDSRQLLPVPREFFTIAEKQQTITRKQQVERARAEERAKMRKINVISGFDPCPNFAALNVKPVAGSRPRTLMGFNPLPQPRDDSTERAQFAHHKPKEDEEVTSVERREALRQRSPFSSGLLKLRAPAPA
jgi:hypothetical protein